MPPVRTSAFKQQLQDFDHFGKPTEIFSRRFEGSVVPYFVNEFWTAKQRAADSLHEVSYRACFKPQLPRFFVQRLTGPRDKVYDPFMGRGTTLIEAALLDRVPLGCDVNPLSRLLCEPRFSPPTLAAVDTRFSSIPTSPAGPVRQDLLAFYHKDTLDEISALREYLMNRRSTGKFDSIDGWIQMVATTRLTGHSKGFFSVYTLPPNQAVSIESQLRINERRKQIPPRRVVREIVLRKTHTLLAKTSPPSETSIFDRGQEAVLLTGSAGRTPRIESGSVQLVVTSPPFLDVVNYKRDNWLRCWFNDVDSEAVEVWHYKKPEEWQAAMTEVFKELHRVLRNSGFVAFEVGEVRNGSLQLEDLVVPAGIRAGLCPEAIVINDQKFTKTSNCWGIENLKKGTNTNRIVLFSRGSDLSQSGAKPSRTGHQPGE